MIPRMSSQPQHRVLPNIFVVLVAFTILVGVYYAGTMAPTRDMTHHVQPAKVAIVTSNITQLPHLQSESYNENYARNILRNNNVSTVVMADELDCMKKKSDRNESVLVIINGQIRGGSIAWKSVQEHLLDFYHADLAFIGPPFTPTEDKDLIAFRNRAKYVWEQPELDDWGQVLDSIGNNSSWRELCTHRISPHCRSHENVTWQFLGGVRNCHDGSAGILLAYRYLTLQKLLENQGAILNDYDWFIYTRADYVYLCSPQPLSYFSSNFLYTPYGQGSGGITDRHTYIPRHLVTRVLNITEHIVINWKFWFDRLCASKSNYINLEKLLLEHLYMTGTHFKNFWHTAFTVRTAVDPSRWARGDEHHIMKKYKLKVKYTSEVGDANTSCDPWKRFHLTHPLQR